MSIPTQLTRERWCPSVLMNEARTLIFRRGALIVYPVHRLWPLVSGEEVDDEVFWPVVPIVQPIYVPSIVAHSPNWVANN